MVLSAIIDCENSQKLLSFKAWIIEIITIEPGKRGGKPTIRGTQRNHWNISLAG
jgi:uncharacterized protein (DUF433 family)